MVFINTTETIGIILGNASTTTTGSLFLTLLLVLVFLFAICILFGIKLEYTAILLLPLLLGYMAYYGDFVAIGMIFLIYLAILLTKNFIFDK